jgi:hypothetical protein
MLENGAFDLPLAPDRPILIQTLTEGSKLWVNAELVYLGADGEGRAYRDRVEVTRETEEEGEAVFGELQAWR